jgi:Nucleotidyltransferase domain
VPRLEGGIEGLDGALVRRVVEQLDTKEPEATAVLLTGSYAKGTAAEASDLDLMAITPSPRVDYRTWFEEQIGEAPLRVSAGATTAEAWLARATTPARWSFGFPAINAASYLCTDEETRADLGNDPSLRHPVAARSSRTSSTSC